MSAEIFHREAFELCARKNLEHALEVMEALSHQESDAQSKDANAAATIRELLAEDCAFFERSKS